jgi:glycosyltransferase involved in cell wall biosynthesis
MSPPAARPIRALHLFSNCKWTGPAEPALNLCLALRARGVHADFACAPDAGGAINKIVETARDRGIDPILDFHLSKHRHPIKNMRDRRRLGRLLDEGNYDLLHCHLDNDHTIALRPAARHGIPLVRSSYEGQGLPADARHRKLLEGTSFLIQPSTCALDHDARACGFARGRMAVIPGAVDVERFDPRRDSPDGRRWLQIPQGAFVIGIVARMQTHRRYRDLLEALQRLVREDKASHLIVVGRGTKQEQVAMAPVRELALEKHVHFTGFIDGENYAGMLKAFDAGVFLVPGSDGTCRAVREIMAMGKPMAVADRGMLGEIVTHGHDGLVFDGTAGSLYESLSLLREDRKKRILMGRNARDTAVTRYSLEAQSQAVLEVYCSLPGLSQ